jgi:hypothetical protein
MLKFLSLLRPSESVLVQIKDNMVEMNADNPTDSNGIVFTDVRLSRLSDFIDFQLYRLSTLQTL